MFTTKEEGFVPIYKYLDSIKKYRISDIVSFLEPYGFEDDFRDMIVLDGVIMNPDRHLGNFGFMVDNDTFEIKGFAPVSRAMLRDETRKKLQELKDVSLRLHEKYNLPKERTDFLENKSDIR